MRGKRTKWWIETSQGIKFDLGDPHPNDVNIKDVAHALSQLCRFNGHTRDFYSVAQHSIMVADKLPPELQLQGLLHDAHKAYTGEPTRPLKDFFKWLDNLRPTIMDLLEIRVRETVRAALGVPTVLDPEVAEVDRRMLMTEKDQLLSGLLWDWKPWDPYEKLRITSWPPASAEKAFLDCYEYLAAGLGRLNLDPIDGTQTPA